MTKEIALNSLHFFNSLKNDTADKKILVLMGGEPLLNYKVVKDVIDYSSKMINGRLCIAIPTNGTLLDKRKLDYFSKRKVIVGVSVDGNFDKNTNRVTSSDVNSYSLIQDKFPLLLKYDNIIIRLTITPDFSKDLHDNFLFFHEKGFRRISFQPATGYFWDDKSIENYIVNYKKIIEFSKKHKVDIRWFDSLVKLKRRLNHCGRIEYTITIDPVGDIYPCSFFTFYERGYRQNFKLGNVTEGTFNRNAEFVRDMQNFKVCDYLNVKCNKCEVSGACTRFCCCYNIRTRRLDKKIAASGYKLFSKIEKMAGLMN